MLLGVRKERDGGRSLKTVNERSLPVFCFMWPLSPLAKGG